MKQVKKVMFIIIVIVLFGCTEKENINDDISKESIPIEERTNNDSEIQEHKNDDQILNYPAFQVLTKNLSDSVKIDGYTFKDSSMGIDAIRIDERLSFGERQWITENGKLESPLKSTQETFFYENSDQSRLIIITAAYSPNYIGDNILYYNVNSGYDINENLAKLNDVITISFRNLTFTVMQTSEDIDMDVTQEFTLGIIHFLEDI
ncbi:hypothetical protein ACM26V_20475 [Salipaludibacillus sp. HK11]|uniref:hypothetical protein n=1 Tax=Salipaludibacillus sp. HK11 TaxID=3394320 RepID=UPI0039FDBB56